MLIPVSRRYDEIKELEIGGGKVSAPEWKLCLLLEPANHYPEHPRSFAPDYSILEIHPQKFRNNRELHNLCNTVLARCGPYGTGSYGSHE